MAQVTAVVKVIEYTLTMTEEEAKAVCRVLGSNNSGNGNVTYPVYDALATELEANTGETF